METSDAQLSQSQANVARAPTTQNRYTTKCVLNTNQISLSIIAGLYAGVLWTLSLIIVGQTQKIHGQTHSSTYSWIHFHFLHTGSRSLRLNFKLTKEFCCWFTGSRRNRLVLVGVHGRPVNRPASTTTNVGMMARRLSLFLRCHCSVPRVRHPFISDCLLWSHCDCVYDTTAAAGDNHHPAAEVR